MNKCSRCNEELIKDLEVHAESSYQVEISYKKRISTAHRAKVKAAVCPVCGEVTLYLEEKELNKIIKDVEVR